MRFASTVAAVALVASCGSPTLPYAPIGSAPPDASGTIRLLLAGDVMMGRRVAPVAAADGAEFFEGIRTIVSGADVAAANLESPLTLRPHVSEGPNALEADPAMSALIAGAGFDVMAVANNHIGDAGDGGVLDTLQALEDAGIESLGGARTGTESGRPVVVVRNGVRVAFLGFDVTGLGPPGDAIRPGVSIYSPESARTAVEEATAIADLVVVSIHGGVEYLLDDDPILTGIATDLTGWGADLVWGHGPHVPQPVHVSGVDGRPVIVATSLGNLVFDQRPEVTRTGLVLEVLAGPRGVEAYRMGRVERSGLRPRFAGWDTPTGPAVLLDLEWWSLVRPTTADPARPVDTTGFPWGDVVAAAAGDITGGGRPLVAVSYRHPFRETEANRLFPGNDFTDAAGMSAHLGVFDPDTFRPVWAAGTLLSPVASVAACDGGLAVAFDTLDDRMVVGTGAWTWWDFGFATAPTLPGAGTPACADVDRNGSSDPVILHRSLSPRSGFPLWPG